MVELIGKGDVCAILPGNWDIAVEAAERVGCITLPRVGEVMTKEEARLFGEALVWGLHADDGLIKADRCARNEIEHIIDYCNSGGFRVE